MLEPDQGSALGLEAVGVEGKAGAFDGTWRGWPVAHCFWPRALLCFTLYCLPTNQKWVLLLSPFYGERNGGSEKLSGSQGHTSERGIRPRPVPKPLPSTSR